MAAVGCGDAFSVALPTLFSSGPLRSFCSDAQVPCLTKEREPRPVVTNVTTHADHPRKRHRPRMRARPDAARPVPRTSCEFRQTTSGANYRRSLRVGLKHLSSWRWSLVQRTRAHRMQDTGVLCARRSVCSDRQPHDASQPRWAHPNVRADSRCALRWERPKSARAQPASFLNSS